MNKPELYNEDYAATYCPESNLLHLYVGRVPRDEYEALKAEGWRSTPKQSEAGGGEFAATWTPERYQTAISYAGIVGDEDMSPEERAADRAERFAGYRDRRTMEAVGHADRYDSGPAVHGYQDYGRAVKAADRHDRIAGRAVDAWGKAEYWQRRTAGVIANALYKSTPAVRMGRIKEIEADIRKIESEGQKHRDAQTVRHGVMLAMVEHAEGKREKMMAAPGWQYYVATIRRHDESEEGAPLTTEQLRRAMISAALGDHYSGKWSELREQVEKGKLCPVSVARDWLDAYGWEKPAPYDPSGSAWHRHLTFRLAYERQMLEAAGGRAGELEMEVGGFFCGKQIHKVNKSAKTDRVVSVQVMGTTSGYTKESGYKEYATRPCLVNVGVERSSPESYRAPTPEEKAAFLAAQKAKKDAAPKKEKAPLINPTDTDAERLQGRLNELAKSDHCSRHLKRYGRDYAEEFKPSTVCRITQAQYSEVSKGAYARAETRGIGRGGNMQPHADCYGTKFRAVCEVRSTGSDGSDYGARRVIVLTDKPQKQLPAEVWESALVEPELVTASNA